MISKQNWKFCFQTPETVWTVFHVTSVLKQAESLWILAMYECALHGIVLTCGCSDDDGLGKCSRAHAVILLQQCLQLLVYSLVSYIQRLALDDPTISDTDHLFAHTIFHRMGKPSSSFHLEDSASLDAPLTVHPFFWAKACVPSFIVLLCAANICCDSFCHTQSDKVCQIQWWKLDASSQMFKFLILMLRLHNIFLLFVYFFVMNK